MKKTLKITTLIFIALTLASSYFYHLHGGLLLKALTSLGFVLTGLINAIYAIASKNSKRAFVFLMLGGLFFSFLGDIIINLSFIPGALIFALGHILYFAAYCKNAAFAARDLICVAAMLTIALAVLALYPYFDFDALILCVCIIYTVIISFMAGKALSNFIRGRSGLNLILALGALLFYASDAALVLYMFGNAGELANTVCLFTYFPAQCVLAYGLHRSID